MLVIVYYKGGRFYVPTIVQTQAGLFWDRSPVRVVERQDRVAFACAIADAFKCGNVRVPNPSVDEFKNPVVSTAAGAKSWSAFMRGATSWTVSTDSGEIRVALNVEEKRGVVPSEEFVSIPGADGAEGVANEIVRSLLEKEARKGLRSQPRAGRT